MFIDKKYIDPFIRTTERAAYGASLYKGKGNKIAADEAISDFEHEHVTPFIRNNEKRFKLGNLKNSIDLSNDRLTVDNKTDYTNKSHF